VIWKRLTFWEYRHHYCSQLEAPHTASAVPFIPQDASLIVGENVAGRFHHDRNGLNRQLLYHGLEPFFQRSLGLIRDHNLARGYYDSNIFAFNTSSCRSRAAMICIGVFCQRSNSFCGIPALIIYGVGSFLHKVSNVTSKVISCGLEMMQSRW
jgi:hypothetical protein